MIATVVVSGPYHLLATLRRTLKHRCSTFDMMQPDCLKTILYLLFPNNLQNSGNFVTLMYNVRPSLSKDKRDDGATYKKDSVGLVGEPSVF